MRRMIAVVLTVLLTAALCLTLAGCDSPKVRVESVLKLNNDFKGSRKITVVYPLNADIDAIKEDLLEDNPTGRIEGATFTYLGAAESGYSFELALNFENQTQYEGQVSAIIGRDANAVLARKNNVMFKGTRVREDFDVSELIGWMVRDTASAETTKEYAFEYPYNKVEIGSETFDTGSTVNVSEGIGIQVKSVEIKTYNEKASLLGRTFDRSFVFSVPADAYTSGKTKINAYFEELTEGNALITDIHEGNSVLLTVTYEGLSLSELETVTGKVLDSTGVSVYYGDKGDLSTPLFEGRVLEETLDTLSFDSPTGNPPTLKYTYSLPTNAVQGEGALFRDGGWVNTGTWDDGAYRVEDSSGMTHLRIFDGRQYYIDGVRFALTALGEERFSRVTSFLYPIKNGFEGPVYAAKFFDGKHTNTTADNDGEHVIVSVTCEGTVDEINAKLESVFGQGNYLAYAKKNGALSDKTTCNDHIDLREMLSIENMSIDMTYTASADNGENIVTLINGGTEKAYEGKDRSAVEIKGCVADVGYHGVIPKAGNIVLYILFGFVLFGLTTFAAWRMLAPPLRRERAQRVLPPYEQIDGGDPPEPARQEKDETPSYAPTQTTTFSIFELGILSRNKKYVEEIDRDVQDRMEAERLRLRKKELRKKELEEMEKKVYGTRGTENADETPDGGEPVREEVPAGEENAPQTVTAPAEEDDAPTTIELLDAFEEANRREPEASEPTDPMELLNLMNEEDDGDGEDGDGEDSGV